MDFYQKVTLRSRSTITASLSEVMKFLFLVTRLLRCLLPPVSTLFPLTFILYVLNSPPFSTYTLSSQKLPDFQNKL